MLIDQANSGASWGYGQKGLDRWVTDATQSGKLSYQQNLNSLTPPIGFTKYIGATSLSAYSVLSTDTFLISQAIEGLNVADLGWGTSNAQTITIQFWVRSSLTGTFGGALQNGSSNRSYPFTFAINNANTWEYKTLTVSGDTAGTWATDNTAGIWLRFNLGTGSSLSGTAGAWAGANYRSATGAVSVVGTAGATFYITGVQLEVGTVATPYEMQIYSDQLAQCQRYYSGPIYCAVGGVTANGIGLYACTNCPVPMRTAPTTTTTTPVLVGSCTTFSVVVAYSNSIEFAATNTTGGSGIARMNVLASAEL